MRGVHWWRAAFDLPVAVEYHVGPAQRKNLARPEALVKDDGRAICPRLGGRLCGTYPTRQPSARGPAGARRWPMIGRSKSCKAFVCGRALTQNPPVPRYASSSFLYHADHRLVGLRSAGRDLRCGRQKLGQRAVRGQIAQLTLDDLLGVLAKIVRNRLHPDLDSPRRFG